jgi:transposase
MLKKRSLLDAYRFPGFRPRARIKGIFGDPQSRVIRLERRQKKRCAVGVAPCTGVSTKVRRIRDLSCGEMRIHLEVEVRRVWCRRCGKVKQETWPWLADNPFYAKRLAWYVGRRCRETTVKEVARELKLDWKTVKSLDKESLQEQLRRTGTPGPKAIGLDEISIKKGHRYRIVVSHLVRRRPIWFGGSDRSEQSMGLFYQCLEEKKAAGIRLAVMDMWRAFETSTMKHAPQAAILHDKVHVIRHLGKALDTVRKQEYKRLAEKDRWFMKGQKDTLLSRMANLPLEWRRALSKLLAANKRLHTAYLLKEAFGQLWEYQTEGWARRFFENWKASLKWPRLKPYEEFAGDDRAALGRDCHLWQS